MASSWLSYYYYDTPEGEDCHKKIFFTTKWTTGIGAMVALHDVLLYSKLTGFYPVFSRSMFWVGPFAGVGATYSAVTCSLLNIRKKDDYWNNVFGGLCSGFVLGAARRHYGIGGVCGAAFALLGFFWHCGHDEDWSRPFIGERGQLVKEYGTYDNWKNDFTLSVDPKDRV